MASVLTPEQEAPALIRVIFETPDGTVRDRDGNLVDDEGAVRIPPGGKQV